MIIIRYARTPYNIVEKQPRLWITIKILFVISNFFVSLLMINKLSCVLNKFQRKNKKQVPMAQIEKSEDMSVIIGRNNCNEVVRVPEKGLYQNILITGTIGSGKTSSAMYPITEQIIEHSCEKIESKIGMLILDVKGNYYKMVTEYSKKYNRSQDCIVIEVGGKYKYNPLDKPNLKASVLANRLKIILELFSGKTTESYWIDKAEQILCEAIKLCRMYNDGYVTFEEIHNMIMSKEYFDNKIKIIKSNFRENMYSDGEMYDINASLRFFNEEFFSLDQRSVAILKSEITRITGYFVSDYEVSKTFSPRERIVNEYNISSIIDDGKIIVLNMNIAEYKNLSKIIAAYLKLDFQAEVLSRLSKKGGSTRAVAFISDEYHEYVTETDADFFGQSREAKCINIVATQSYKSMMKTLKDEVALSVILQNLINKIWYRTDDAYTIEEAQKQIGKEEKEKISRSISEGAKETRYSPFERTFKAKDSNISESINSSYEKDFVYDVNYFTRELKTFQALVFLSNGEEILNPQKLNMIPYFERK